MYQAKITSISLFLCLASCGSRGEKWDELPLDKQVSIQVPGVVKKQTLHKTLAPGRVQTTNIFLSRDSKALYQAVTVHDSDSTIEMTSPAARRSVYEDASRALLAGQMNSVLLKSSPFTTAAGTGIEIKFRAVHLGTGEMVTKYSRMLIVGRIAYSFGFTAEGKDPADEERMRFFNSISFKTKTPSD